MILAVLAVLAARAAAEPEAEISGSTLELDGAARTDAAADLDDSRDDEVRFEPSAIVVDDGEEGALPTTAPFDLDGLGAPGAAGFADAREARLRAHASPIGRVEISLAWRRVTTETRATQEVWLIGTWRL